jgi:hypothetical protein
MPWLLPPFAKLSVRHSAGPFKQKPANCRTLQYIDYNSFTWNLATRLKVWGALKSRGLQSESPAHCRMTSRELCTYVGRRVQTPCQRPSEKCVTGHLPWPKFSFSTAPVLNAGEIYRSIFRSSPTRHSSKVGAVCVKAPVRFCAGGDQRWSSLPRQLPRRTILLTS